jgi:hypothetical protein
VFIRRDQFTVSIRDDSISALSITPDNAEAVRTELLRQIETSGHELEGQLAALRNTASGNHDLLDDGVAKLHRLNFLRDQLVGGAKGVAALRADIASAIAATHAYTSSVSAVIGTALATPAEQAAQTLRNASDASHRTVADFSRDFYDRKIFDPYLQFASTEDKEAYHRREAERRLAIEKAQAENTPEGTLRANTLAIEQLHDAGAHGADRSPDYKSMLQNLELHKRELERRMAHQPLAPTEGRSAKLSAASDAACALRAAGVSLADASDTPCVASVKPPASHAVGA